MKRKQVLAAIMTAILAASVFAGCGENAAESTQAPAQEAAAAVEEAAEEAVPDEEPAAEADETGAEWDGEVDEISVMLLDMYGKGMNGQKVIDAMNEITEKSCGVRIGNVTFAGAGDYGTKLSMAIAGGEAIDVCSVFVAPPSDFNTLYSNHQLLDITEYIESDAREMMELVGDYIGAFSVGGRIYGVPAYRNYANSAFLLMREDILDEIGMKDFAKNMTTFTEVDELMAKIKENYDFAPIGTSFTVFGNLYGEDAFADRISYDTLGDSFSVVFTDESGKVSSLLDNEAWLKHIDRVRDFYNKDYIYKDVLTTTETGDQLLKAGVCFSDFDSGAIGIEAQKRNNTGRELVALDLGILPLNTGLVQRFGLGVPITSEEPEAAVRWLNALYTDPALSNLLLWGVEGEDYVVENGEAKYPEGLTAENVEYHMPDFLCGNYFNVYPWEGSGADFRQVAFEALKAAEVSPFLGFSVDQSELTNTIAAISSVNTEYRNRVYAGVVTVEEVDDYKAKLETAGLQDYLNAFQVQLDAWKTAQ